MRYHGVMWQGWNTEADAYVGGVGFIKVGSRQSKTRHIQNSINRQRSANGHEQAGERNQETETEVKTTRAKHQQS